MIVKIVAAIILSLSIIPCMAQNNDDKADKTNTVQSIESEPVKINIPVENESIDVDNVDLSVTKRIDTNVNMCIENKYFSITLTNEIDTVTLGNNLINTNICEESTFSCEGTNSLHQTGARIIICPK